MTSNHLAKLEVSPEILLALLDIPDTTEILDVEFRDNPVDLGHAILLVTISNDELPGLVLGDPIPLIHPKYRTANKKEIFRMKRLDWGIKENGNI